MAAKINGTLLNAMRERITPLDTPELRAQYQRGDFPRAELVKDLNVRYRWDLFHGSGVTNLLLGQDLTTDHIDTALRSIIPEL